MRESKVRSAVVEEAEGVEGEREKRAWNGEVVPPTL